MMSVVTFTDFFDFFNNFLIHYNEYNTVTEHMLVQLFSTPVPTVDNRH